MQTAQQRNIPITDERSITPESISSFESMYGIEAPPTPESTPDPPQPTTQQELGPEAVRSRIAGRQSGISSYTPEPGRHSEGSQTGGRHEIDSNVEPHETSSEGRRLRQEGNQSQPGDTISPTDQTDNNPETWYLIRDA